jgi:hypothetical protein
MKDKTKKIGIGGIVAGVLIAGSGWVGSYVDEKKLENKLKNKNTLTIEEAYEAVNLYNKKIKKAKSENEVLKINGFKKSDNLMKKLDEKQYQIFNNSSHGRIQD